MQNEHSHIVKISTNGWYVETPTGFDGPFDSEQEAATFQDLIQTSNAARMEFAGLAYSPTE